MKKTSLTAIRNMYIGSLTLLLAVSAVLPAEGADWQRKDVDWNAGSGRRIRGIRYPANSPAPLGSEQKEEIQRPKTKSAYSVAGQKSTAVFANEMLIESPPVDGFVPWIAVSVTTRRKDELELEADVETWVRGSYPPGVNAETDYVIGLFDTGASAHVMGYADGQRTGAYPSLITDSEIVVSGVTGSVVASVTQPLAIYIDGLDAIDPETLVLDQANMMGQSNVAIMVGQDPGSVFPDLPTAIGSPMSVYYTTLISNERTVTVERDGETFTAPEIKMYEADDPDAPKFSNVIPLELRPLGGVSVQYVPTLDMGLGGFDFDDILGGNFGSDFPPASPSVIIGNSSQSLFFVHSVDLYDGQKSAIDKGRFMLDTGAQVTVVESRVAARLQLDPAAPEFEVEIEGVTGEVSMMPGYYVDAIDIPALGQWFQARNVPVVLLDVSSPEGGTLDGIIGMNLFTEFNLIVRGGGLFLETDPSLELQRITSDTEPEG